MGRLEKPIIKNRIFCIITWFALVLMVFWRGIIRTGDAYYPGYKLFLILFMYILGGITIISGTFIFCDKIQVSSKNVLCIIGKNSMYIYILHCIFVYYLQLFGANYWYEYFLIGFLAVVIPLLIAKIIRNTIIDKLLFKPMKLFSK